MRSPRLLLVPLALAAVVGLAGCIPIPHFGASGSGGSSSSGSSKSDSPSDDASAASDDTAKGGCPAALTAALEKDSTTDSHEGSVADLAYPGDTAVFADACVIVVKSSSGDTVMAFVPGEADKADAIKAGVEAAGFTSLTSDASSTFYLKDKESWIVATSDAGNPLAAGFGDTFSGPVVTVMHVITV